MQLYFQDEAGQVCRFPGCNKDSRCISLWWSGGPRPSISPSLPNSVPGPTQPFCSCHKHTSKFFGQEGPYSALPWGQDISEMEKVKNWMIKGTEHLHYEDKLEHLGLLGKNRCLRSCMVQRKTFLHHGYSAAEIEWAFKKYQRHLLTHKTPLEPLFAVIPLCNTITNHLARLLQRQNIKRVLCPPLKVKHLLRPVQDPLRLQVPGVYSIPCECGVGYNGQTRRSVAIRQKEHQRHFRLGNVEKSARASHGREKEYKICF